MVLDAKALTWAAKNNIDTAKLKAARVPIYGKWYFPEIPPAVPLVNLESGEQEVFSERMVAGEVIYRHDDEKDFITYGDGEMSSEGWQHWEPDEPSPIVPLPGNEAQGPRRGGRRERPRIPVRGARRDKDE